MTLDESERVRCEIWTRVMGYHRPVSAFNPGKQSEHSERLMFKEGNMGASIDQRVSQDIGYKMDGTMDIPTTEPVYQSWSGIQI